MLGRWLSSLLIASYAGAQNAPETCKALVMSGGGSNGAWESGVLWGLIHYGNPEDYQYDVLAGVSIGGINSAAMAMFEKGDEVNAADTIY